MKRIYAPWRHDYVTKKSKSDLYKGPLKNDCVFCHKFDSVDDDKHYILKRFQHCAVIMNYYPYNTGHIMVVPLQHGPDLKAFDAQERAEMMEAVTASSAIVEKVLSCQGLNIGINLGLAGGGGIPSHLHIHILPRWRGDTNFLATLAETNLICTDFMRTFKDLRVAFADISI